MQPARGDRRPCECAGCAGTMQFGRESDNGDSRLQPTAPVGRTVTDPTGWVCSRDPSHFRPAS